MSSDSRPWHPIPIADCGEPLLALPPALLRLEPHPYAAAGAPYGEGQTPFQLRVGVVQRLLRVQQALQRLEPTWQVAVFDGWRPVAVQQFMVDLTIAQQCQQADVDPSTPSVALEQIKAAVGRFWAPPSLDPATPPPHSTGAAVDLTLALNDGTPLAMGGAIDAIGAVSEPDHHAAAAAADPAGAAAIWHRRRCLLRQLMGDAGFAQHPNEWWHFSHGDQLWAWQQHRPQAIYGRIEP
ncbi:MAG: M15 family metallopeptidase [Cyanobacteriota bacterium]|nr:M15 family metallopeptidase [Cyanobacteriota bacterium]